VRGAVAGRTVATQLAASRAVASNRPLQPSVLSAGVTFEFRSRLMTRCLHLNLRPACCYCLPRPATFHLRTKRPTDWLIPPCSFSHFNSLRALILPCHGFLERVASSGEEQQSARKVRVPVPTRPGLRYGAGSEFLSASSRS